MPVRDRAPATVRSVRAARPGRWRAGRGSTYARSMTVLRVAAVQAAPVLMDREATLARVADLTRSAAAGGAELVVFPEAFVPGPPVWIDTARIWDGDEQWYGLLADQAVVVPSPATARLADIAREAGVWLIVGVDERGGGTIYNTLLYFAPDGTLARHPSEADANRVGADCLGDGRRIDNASDRDAFWPTRRADLLGELHAAGALSHVRAGRGRLGRADARDRRRLGGDDAAHSSGGADVCDRGQPLHSRRSDPGLDSQPRRAVPARGPRARWWLARCPATPSSSTRPAQ